MTVNVAVSEGFFYSTIHGGSVVVGNETTGMFVRGMDGASVFAFFFNHFIVYLCHN
jgi:hypothetical protein